MMPFIVLGCQKPAVQAPVSQIVGEQTKSSPVVAQSESRNIKLPPMPPLQKNNIDLTLQPIVDVILVQHGIDIKTAVKRRSNDRVLVDGISKDNQTISKLILAMENHPSFYGVYLNSIEQFDGGRLFRLSAVFDP